MVGTSSANTKSAGLFRQWFRGTRTDSARRACPNGQNFWTPQTQDWNRNASQPYYYKDSLFILIRNSRLIVGGCTRDYGSFTVAAISGKLRTQPEQRATRFSHKDEISHPHYYSVTLPDEHLRTELTATSHCALIRVTPEKTSWCISC